MRTIVAALIVSLLASSCGGGGVSGGTSSGGGSSGNIQPLNVPVAGGAIYKLRTNQAGWTALVDAPRRLTDYSMPDRRLVLSANGTTLSGQWQPPADWSLIDFAVHPSGQHTAVLASQTSIRLVRLSAQGTVLAETEFADAAAPADPYYGEPYYIRDSNALVPHATRDAVRIGAAGEQVAMALRTGRNAVVAYRLSYSAAGFHTSWRTLVEPGVAIGSVFITSGSFDPFAGLENQWRVAMDVDARGRIAVAVLLNRTELAEGHAQYFGEPVSENVVHGAILTVVDEHGQRSPATVIDTGKRPEIHAVKWNGDKVVVGGRVFSENRADGTGWNGLVVVVDPYLRTLRPLQALDVDRGDVVFDFAVLPTGQLLAAGSTGYIQNPAGASISEDAAPLVAVLDADGKFVRRIPLAAAPRHNQVRSLAAWHGQWLAAGMLDGPGTHSGDASQGLIRADGFVREVRPAL